MNDSSAVLLPSLKVSISRWLPDGGGDVAEAPMLQIFDATLGSGYVDPWTLARAQLQDCILIARVGAQLVGAAFGFRYAAGDELAGLTELERDGRVVYLSAIAVTPELQRKGIGTDLLRAFIAHVQADADVITAHAWKESPARPERLFQHAGFELRLATPEFWRAASIASGRPEYCPRCGNPCDCTALAYALVLRKPLGQSRANDAR